MEIRDKHPLAGQTVKINLAVAGNDRTIDPDQLHGADFEIEDWWENINGQSWMDSYGNPAALKYGMRAGFSHLPVDNQVVYGKVGLLGHLIHQSELPIAAELDQKGK